jgi:hypothetical protein
LPKTLAVKALCSGFGRYGGQVAQVIVFTAIGDGFEVFRISPVGDAHTSNLALFCHSLLFFYNAIIRKLIAGNSAALFHEADDSLGIGICARNLVQCIFDETMIFHFCITPFGNSIYTVRSLYAINKEKGCGEFSSQP